MKNDVEYSLKEVEVILLKYLFFDIECAATYKGGYTPIYSFGYVKTDDSFNIINQEDLIINPNIKTNSWCKHVKQNFLAYDIELVESRYIFSNQYRNLKEMIECDSQIVFFFAAGNDDITYLNNECDRYKKDYLKFKSVNVCELIKAINGRRAKSLLVEYANCYCENKYVLEVLNIVKSANLDELTDEFFSDVLGIDKSIHRSDFDAYLTMMIVKYYQNKDKDLFDRVISKITFDANKGKTRTIAV